MVNGEENDRLIDEEGRKRSLSKKKVLLIISCLCFLAKILIIIVIVVVAAKRHKTKSNSGKKALKELNHTKITLPENLTVTALLEMNEKLCKSLTNESTSEDKYEGFAHLYIVKDDSNLTDKQACGIESILRLFPDKTIFLIDFNKHENLVCNKCSSPPNYLGLLLYLYKDRLQIIFADKDTFFKDTPLRQFSTKDKRFEFFAILLTAYKYGGFVVTPNIVLNNRDLLECFPEETVVEPFVILSPQKCDNFIFYLMESFGLCGPEYNMPLEEMLTKSVELFVNSNYAGVARRLTSDEICLNSSLSSSTCTFLKPKDVNEEDSKWVCELSPFCKQVVQAFLGIKVNQMEVEEETSKIKSHIASKKKTCKPHKVHRPSNKC